jgi:hypothetical protein
MTGYVEKKMKKIQHASSQDQELCMYLGGTMLFQEHKEVFGKHNIKNKIIIFHTKTTTKR